MRKVLKSGVSMTLGESRAWVLAAVVVLLAVGLSAGQRPIGENKYKAQEIDEVTGVPVLMEHLPKYEAIGRKAVFAKDLAGLEAALGDRPELDLIDFMAGTEAVTAPYDAGKLLIVEYSSPQLSAEADAKFQQAAAENPGLDYKRTGNYNIIVFDVTDRAAADSLIDQVKYEKSIQWLGEPPPKKKGVTVPQMAGVLFSSLIILVVGGALALVAGAVPGFLYYRVMLGRRAKLPTFSDAGGLTRLNLDGFTPEILPERLLGE